MSEQSQSSLEQHFTLFGSARPLLRGAAVLFFGAMLGITALSLTRRTQPAAIIIEPPPPTATPVPTATPGPVRVYVNGAVAAPEVYELPPGAIVKDAITAAGGFTASAYRDVVNLAQPLVDGMQIYVPTQTEREEGAVAPPPILVNTLTGTADGTAAESNTGRININTATKAELETLPGIGPATAQKILDHRDANGPFTTIEGIMDVSGIGPAKFDGVKDLITVDD